MTSPEPTGPTTSPELVEGRVRTIAADLLDAPIEGIVRIERGHAHQNWRIRSRGRDLLVKVSKPGHALAKLESATRSWHRASAAGVAVPELLVVAPKHEPAGGRTVRILEWLPGQHPYEVVTDPERMERFFSGFATELARFHGVECEAFSSRVGGTPSFDSWARYVEYRCAQIRERGKGSRLLPEPRLHDLLDEAVQLARRVSPVVRPSLTHRDLYLDNLLAAPDGSFAGLLDLDLTEAWDPMADLVKPRWQIFDEFPGSEAIFRTAYRAVRDDVVLADERLRLAAILELGNQVINAELDGEDAHARSGHDRLLVELGERDAQGNH